jgi:hypothetical protein
MSIADTLLPEFEQEMATTRRLLERVPSDRGEWKPHAKSFSLGHLAQLVSRMPGWVANTLTKTELEPTSTLVFAGEDRDAARHLDQNVSATRLLRAAQDVTSPCLGR